MTAQMFVCVFFLMLMESSKFGTQCPAQMQAHQRPTQVWLSSTNPGHVFLSGRCQRLSMVSPVSCFIIPNRCQSPVLVCSPPICFVSCSRNSDATSKEPDPATIKLFLARLDHAFFPWHYPQGKRPCRVVCVVVVEVMQLMSYSSLLQRLCFKDIHIVFSPNVVQ